MILSGYNVRMEYRLDPVHEIDSFAKLENMPVGVLDGEDLLGLAVHWPARAASPQAVADRLSGAEIVVIGKVLRFNYHLEQNGCFELMVRGIIDGIYAWAKTDDALSLGRPAWVPIPRSLMLHPGVLPISFNIEDVSL